MNKTTLNSRHRQLGAKMTDFHGWEMPLYYTSILEEHKSVRTAVGMFDISHMGQVLIQGPGSLALLNELCVSNFEQVGEKRACYTLMLNERGGMVDDLIIYRVQAEAYVVIVNCANRATDVEWMTRHRQGAVEIRDISDGRSIIAVQGPAAVQAIEAVLGVSVSGLARFSLMELDKLGAWAWIARTGYTGSDGFEVFLEDDRAQGLWDRLLEAGRPLSLQPVGLGARDTLRLEAGLRLYGTDMDDTTTPYEADLGWTVAIHKPSFLGKEAVVRQQTQGLRRRLVGFELAEGPVPRSGYGLFVQGRQIGAVTSGTFSLMLNKPIGLGYVEMAFAPPGTALTMHVREHRYTATVVKLPFWRRPNHHPPSRMLSPLEASQRS